MSHIFTPAILREYDIRGTVGKTLHVADAHALGKAFGTFVVRAGGKHVMVGYDGRTHSPDFEAALVEGLLSTGLNIERIGCGPTPMLYFSTQYHKADAGIMVTGSHNPPDQNGFKMLLAKYLPGGGPVYGEAVKKLAALAAKDDFVTGKGSEKKIDIREAYIDLLLKAYKGTKPLKVVWDCGNGASGEIVQRLTKKLPGTHMILFGEIDGRFPNHEPDPSDEKNLHFLQEEVRKQKADCGIAFDGDADRCIAVDNEGRALMGDQLLMIYASDILKSHPGAPVIADVKASQTLFDDIKRLGGQPVMWKTGNPLIKAKMAELNAPLGGEMSGHIFFGDNHNFDDGIYAAMKLLSLVSRADRSLGAWRDALPAMVSAPETRFRVDEARKFGIVDEVKARLQKTGANVNPIDGVRVMTMDGWWLLRASNTDALLVTRAEAKDEAGLTRLKAQLTDQLKASGVTPPAF
jgi:phosphomannomutase